MNKFLLLRLYRRSIVDNLAFLYDRTEEKIEEKEGNVRPQKSSRSLELIRLRFGVDGRERRPSGHNRFALAVFLLPPPAPPEIHSPRGTRQRYKVCLQDPIRIARSSHKSIAVLHGP